MTFGPDSRPGAAQGWQRPGVLAHYERLDGRGGFLIEELQEDGDRGYEITISYGPWIQFEVFPVTTIEDAFPVIQRVYG